MAQDSEYLLTIASQSPVIAILTIDHASDAVPLANALLSGGLTTLEITLRTPAALEAIRLIAQNVEGAIVGAGTVLDAASLSLAEGAGAQFAVSPGATQNLLAAAEETDIVLLPGASSASEIMALGDQGYTVLKFFPAESAGGLSFLKSIASPLPQYKFCPTGGVTKDLAVDYLQLPNVICVGGTWMINDALIRAGDWAAVTALAASAIALAQLP